jgi:hypothetical protein
MPNKPVDPDAPPPPPVRVIRSIGEVRMLLVRLSALAAAMDTTVAAGALVGLASVKAQLEWTLRVADGQLRELGIKTEELVSAPADPCDEQFVASS